MFSLVLHYILFLANYNFPWFSFQAPDNRAKCAKFIKKCLEFLEEPDHLVTLSAVEDFFFFFWL